MTARFAGASSPQQEGFVYLLKQALQMGISLKSSQTSSGNKVLSKTKCANTSSSPWKAWLGIGGGGRQHA